MVVVISPGATRGCRAIRPLKKNNKMCCPSGHLYFFLNPEYITVKNKIVIYFICECGKSVVYKDHEYSIENFRTIVEGMRHGEKDHE